MKIEWNLWIDEYKGIAINGKEGEEPVILLREGELTADQHAAMHFVVEVARCLLMGKSIDHTFNPNPHRPPPPADEPKVYVRCHWLKSGKLVLLGESHKKWKHVQTVEEALERQRVFTCTRELYEVIPRRRKRTTKKLLTIVSDKEP